MKKTTKIVKGITFFLLRKPSAIQSAHSSDHMDLVTITDFGYTILTTDQEIESARSSGAQFATPIARITKPNKAA